MTVRIIRARDSEELGYESCTCNCSTCGKRAPVRWVANVELVPDPNISHSWWCCSKHCAQQGAMLAISGIDAAGINDADFKPRRKPRPKPPLVEHQGRQYLVLRQEDQLAVSVKMRPPCNDPRFEGKRVPCDVCDRWVSWIYSVEIGEGPHSWWACSKRCVTQAQVRHLAGDTPRSPEEIGFLVDMRDGAELERRRLRRKARRVEGGGA